MQRTLDVVPVAAGPREGRSVVEFRAGAGSIWFDSADAALEPSPEAAGSALLLPALRSGRRLRLLEGTASHTWRSNVERLVEIWNDWWGYSRLVPQVALRPDAAPPATQIALCFTGGLDSFYTLLRGDRRPDVLVFVQGFDIPLEDDVRMAAWDAELDSVAAATGAAVVRLRSNLRAHPLVSRSQWDRAHGGALAAVGHLLSARIGTLLIASSAPTRYGYTWGSHESTDPLWSSDRLRVVHHGASASRIDKLRAIADERLVHQYLRVCWENRVPAGNCSACDKCVSTMAIVAAGADPARFRTFDWSVPVAGRIARLRSTRFVRTYRELLDLPLERQMRTAIEALLRRNVLPQRLRSLWHRWRG